MNFVELKEFLDHKASQFENVDFIQEDPIQIPHRFSKKEDIEISAFITSTIAWGNRKGIIKSANHLMEIFENSPYEFIKHYNSELLKNSKFVHRTFNLEDLNFFLKSLQNIYQKNGLEYAFNQKLKYHDLKQRIVDFRTLFFSIEHPLRTQKHVSNPEKKAASKRINMFLRWMVRNSKNGVDFGLWTNIQPAELYLPLDVHTANISRKLGLLQRKQNDWQALEELMAVLRQMDAKDPVKYDFALFGLGAIEKF